MINDSSPDNMRQKCRAKPVLVYRAAVINRFIGAFVENVPMAQTPLAEVITDRMQYSTHESVNSTNDGASRPSAGNG